MATTAEYPHGGDMGSLHAGGHHDLPHMADDADVLVDPRMGMSFYGIKAEKDAAADSPSQFMLTPRMFGSDLDGNPIDYLGELPDESVLDPGETAIEVAAASGAPMVSPPETDSRTSPSSQPPPAASPKRAAASNKRQPAAPAPAPAKLKRTTRAARAVQQLKRAGAAAAASASSSSSKGGGGGGGTSTTGSRRDARRSRCLERNRIAASKCREKKKQWVQDLESAKAELEQQHASLQAECAGLLDEATQIKNWLMEHAGCGDANIDAWIGNEAMRFVQRSGTGPGTGPGHGGSRHSSIGSLASLQSRNGERDPFPFFLPVRECPSLLTTVSCV